jgi:hypothetical protein
MREAPRLRLRPDVGVCDDVNTGGRSPRQVCVGVADSLRRQGVAPSGARANIIIDGEGTGLVGSGSIIICGDVVLRVTMVCEPCTYGANLAEVPTRRFRGIERYLAIVVEGGTVEFGAYLDVADRVFPVAPPDFRTRTAWAMDYIPSGHIVTSLEFLRAIGASKSYARVLPAWLSAAHIAGKPTHRVLTAMLSAPSWAPDALVQLRNEGVSSNELADATFPLTHALWFDGVDHWPALLNNEKSVYQTTRGAGPAFPYQQTH